MLFAPEVQLEQEQHEKDLKEARAFFENMPDHGIVIHGGVQEYAEAKKHNGLKYNYNATSYLYIPKPSEAAKEDDIIATYKSAIEGIGDVSGYAFGETTTIFSERANPGMLANEYLVPKVIYKNHAELNPTFLCYEAPKEVFEQFNGIVRAFPQEIRVSDYPVDGSNLLFEVTLNYQELSRFPEINEATGGLKSKVLERIKQKGWSKEIPLSNFQLEKDGKYLPIEDLVVEMLNKSHHNPLYAEAIAISKKAHTDINQYVEVLKYLIEETQLITKQELASARHPMALYELTLRYKQIKESGVSFEEKREKVLRMIGSSETSRFKREYAILNSINLAAKLRHKYGDIFAGIVIYGSQIDKYKGDSPEIDLKVIIKPNQDPTQDYGQDNQILNDIEEYMLTQMGFTCKPTILYTNDLEQAQTDTTGELTDQIATKNSGLDAKCVPIIFGRKNRQLFRHIFDKNLKLIQTR